MQKTSNSIAAWARGLAVLGGVGGLLALGWLLPGSPVTMWRADAALATGEIEAAADLYDEVADHGWWGELRTRALARSASVHADRLGDVDTARTYLERLLAETVDAAERARLRERMAWSEADAGDALAASINFVAAVEADPAASQAAERLILAARYADRAEDMERANSLWERIVTEHPDQAALANLALGRLALRGDRAQDALAHFQGAAASSSRPDVAVAAQLGAATALERLGSLESAIAELDESELPAEVAESRLDALRLRREARER